MRRAPLLSILALAACTRATTTSQPAKPRPDARVEIEPTKPDAGLASASPDTAEPPFPARVASGDRLKVLYGQVGEEKYFLWAFYDTMLKVPCAFELAQDGKLRCLPLAPKLSLPHSTECMGGQPLFPVDPACTTAYARWKVNGRVSVYKVGAPLVPLRAVRSYMGPWPPPVDAGAPDGGALEEGVVGGCSADAAVAGQKFLPLGDLVPPDTFVETELDGHAIQQPGRRILLWGRVATDGSKERFGYFDTKFNQRCNVEVAADGKLRCLPAYWLSYPLGYFADASCSEPLMATRTANLPSPVFAGRTDASRCPAIRVLADTEERPGLQQVYYRRDGVCTAIAPDPALRFFALKGEHSFADFDEFTETREGAGRLQRRVLRNADGIVDRLSDPFDRDFADRCVFARTSDGMLRCVPPPGGRDDLFADATCGKGAARPAQSLCLPKPAAHATRMGGPWCDAIAQIHSLGGTPATTYQRDLQGTCEATYQPQYLELGPPLPPAGFVAAQQIME